MRATASAMGTPFSWLPSRNRKLTVSPARSFSPAMSWNGTFCVVCVRIFFCMRSSLVSSSARTPARRSWSITPPRYSEYSSATGMPTTCTGESQTGKAPA